MRSWKPSRGELLFLSAAALIWLAILCWLPPNMGGTDDYMFRDPACNFAAGLGFRSASVDHAHSFQPMLYSHYTPLSLWLFIPVAKFFGCTAVSNQVFGLLWAALIDIVVVVVGLRFLIKASHRWLFLFLAAVLLPYGVVPREDRPEPVSFCILVALAILLRRRPTVATSLAAGLLGAAAFLSEPFAGVVAFFLIAGWMLATLFESSAERKVPFGKLAALSLLAAVCYAAPVTITAVSFYKIDHQSLQRFMYQAVNTGVSRDTSYTMGEGKNWNAAKVDQSSRLGKIEDGLRFRRILGPVREYELAIDGLVVLTWIGLVLLSRGDAKARLFLALAGLFCCVLPFVMFPMQGHYLMLGCALLPVLLGLNWAFTREALRTTAAIPVLLAIAMLSPLPAVALNTISLAESRAAYRYAFTQTATLRDYLQQHPLAHPVVLVPTSHYFLYKDIAHNIYNPTFLSYRYQDPDQIGAVVNCYTGVKDFAPGTLPLPPFVAAEKWQEISVSRDPVAVTLFHRKIMSRNWSPECDLYVRANP
jgi:hypothetical protein